MELRENKNYYPSSASRIACRFWKRQMSKAEQKPIVRPEVAALIECNMDDRTDLWCSLAASAVF